MSARTAARFVALPAAVIGFGVLAVAPALAHVTISPSGGAANDYTVATLSVPHGCDGSATTSITVKIPDELVKVTPTRNAFWDVTKTMTTLATPIKAENGDEITEKVATVVYTAKTPLPDGYRDAFQLSFQVPDVVGKTLVFPTIQKCVKGQTAWTETTAPGAEEPEHPAPTFTVVAAADSGTAEVIPTSSDDEGASEGLAYAGLGVGALGLVTAAAALAKGRRKA